MSLSQTCAGFICVTDKTPQRTKHSPDWFGCGPRDYKCRRYCTFVTAACNERRQLLRSLCASVCTLIAAKHSAGWRRLFVRDVSDCVSQTESVYALWRVSNRNITFLGGRANCSSGTKIKLYVHKLSNESLMRFI